MKLILIHGAPGVGKFTVAKQLAKITGYRLLHIHSILDLLAQLVDKRSICYWKLTERLIIDIVGTAFKCNVNGMILTYGDIAFENFKFVKRLVKAHGKNGGKVHFVHLHCDESELMKRVVSQSRKKFGKVKTRRKLKKVLSEWDFYTAAPSSDTLRINNTKLSPKKTAALIKKKFNL